MASSTIQPWSNQGCRPTLSEIDALISARLGPTRVSGNAQLACFNRQVAMYLASRLEGWSTTAIGEFYSGRDHSTVCHGIQRIESLQENDPEVDALQRLSGRTFHPLEQRVFRDAMMMIYYISCVDLTRPVTTKRFEVDSGKIGVRSLVRASPWSRFLYASAEGSLENA